MSFNSAGRRGRRVWWWWKVLWGRGARYWLTIRRWCLSVCFCVWRAMNHHWNFTCVSSFSLQPPLATLKQLRKKRFHRCAVSPTLHRSLYPPFMTSSGFPTHLSVYLSSTRHHTCLLPHSSFCQHESDVTSRFSCTCFSSGHRCLLVCLYNRAILVLNF